jgi:hypothetical protein
MKRLAWVSLLSWRKEDCRIKEARTSELKSNDENSGMQVSWGQDGRNYVMHA